MPRIDNPNDPYATPHAPKERGGPMLRMAIIAVLLAGAGAGYAYYSTQPSDGLVGPPVEEAAIDHPIRVADAGAVTSPDTATDATSDAAPAAAPAPEPAPTRRAAPRAAPAPTPEPAPAPVVTPTPAPMTTPTPIAPLPTEQAPMPTP